MSKKYWQHRALKLQKEKEDNEQISGCLALVLTPILLIIISYLCS